MVKYYIFSIFESWYNYEAVFAFILENWVSMNGSHNWIPTLATVGKREFTKLYICKIIFRISVQYITVDCNFESYKDIIRIGL